MKAANAEGTQQALDQMKGVFGPEPIDAKGGCWADDIRSRYQWSWWCDSRFGFRCGPDERDASCRGGSLEMAAAKPAYADGARWTVRNAEVLAADGKTVLARQNPITGKYDAVSPNPLINAGNGTGTVWDSIKATQPPHILVL